MNSRSSRTAVRPVVTTLGNFIGRSVVYSPHFELVAVRVLGNVEDARLQAVEWFLAQTASFAGFNSLGTHPTEGAIFVVRTDPTPAFPRVSILFTVASSGTVTLQDLVP
jgi:hypothetical protein